MFRLGGVATQSSMWWPPLSDSIVMIPAVFSKKYREFSWMPQVKLRDDAPS
jgi:hypothetical protein